MNFVVAYVLRNRWAQYLALAVLAIGIAIGVRAYLIHLGVERGKEQQKQVEQEDAERKRRIERAKDEEELESHVTAAAEFHARSEKAKALAIGYAAEAESMRSGIETGHRQIAGLADSQLHSQIVQTLAIRPPSDTSPGFYPQEEREVLTRVMDAPKLKALVEKHTQQIEQLTLSAEEGKKELGEVKEQLTVRTRELDKADAAYVDLWNLHPPVYRSVKCLWIKKCGKRKLPANILSPEQLKKSQGGTK
jgi:hypothetical protein